MREQTLTNKLFTVGLVIIFAVAVILRLTVFTEVGGDHVTYKQAVLEFTSGINPYKNTVTSFKVSQLEHGYAYFPTLLYILTFMWELNVIFSLDVATAILWKIPVLVADFTIALLLFNYFKDKNKLVALFSVAYWLFNPYFLSRFEFTMYDQFQVLFLFLALNYLGKKDFLSGTMYALALSIKIIPVIVFPVFLIFSKNRLKTIGALFLTFLVISIPFLLTFDGAYNYIFGTLLVHGERGVQGRPFFTFLTYYLQSWEINLLQSKFAHLYTVLSLISGPIFIVYLALKRKLENPYTLTAVAFAFYLLLTPILSRTHILWALPFFLIAIYHHFKGKLFYIFAIILYMLLFIYLFLWQKGFKAPTENNNRVWIDGEQSIEYKLPLIEKLKFKIRGY